MKTRSIAAVALLFIQVMTAGAQSPASASRQPTALPLDECLQLGIAASSGIRTVDAAAAEAKGRLAEMKYQLIPSAVLSASYLRLSDIDQGAITVLNPDTHLPMAEISLGEPILDNMAMKFSVQQPLFLGYRIRGAIDQSAAALEAVLGDRDRKVQQVSAAIETAYWTAAGAREAATVFAEYVTQAKRHQEDARNYLAQGLVTRNDLLKAEMRVSGAETQRLDADTAFVAARMRLNLLLGFPWDAPTETEALPDGDASGAMAFTGKDVDTLLSAGLSARRELDSARSRIKADQAAFAVARAPLYPNVFATGDVAIAEPNQRFFPQLNEFKTTWSAGILVSIDAGKVPATMAQVEQASARLRRDTEALSAMEDTVTREIVTAYLDLQKSRQQVLNARTLLAQAEESIRTTRDLFDKGVALGADVSDAEAALLAARLQQVSARIAVLNSAASLRLAVGQAGTGNR